MINHTSITIAICTYNRAEYLSDTLRYLSDQNADPNDFEILVINNNSSDQTAEICADFAEKNPHLNFKAVEETKQGLSFARNRAIEEAIFESILYIDDDVHLPKDFVNTALHKLQKNTDAKCIGGQIKVSFDDGEPDWIPAELMPMFGLHDLGDREKVYPKTNFPRGGNMLIKKEVFDAIGRFDTDLGRIGKELLGSEEKAFFDRAREHGFQFYYWPEVSLYHRIGQQRLSSEYLKNQSIGIGYSEKVRLRNSFRKRAAKLASEFVKFAGSIVLSFGYLLRGKTKAASFILKFRVWVLSGFMKSDRGGA